MVTIPIYDQTVLPCLTPPMGNTHVKPTKYLGGRALTNGITATMEAFAKNDAQLNALYLFWRDVCNYGLEPFLVALPLFGEVANIVHPDVLCKFTTDFNASKDNNTWKANLTLEVLGKIVYIIDDLGNFVVSDAGEYVMTNDGDFIATGNQISSIRSISYAS